MTPLGFRQRFRRGQIIAENRHRDIILIWRLTFDGRLHQSFRRRLGIGGQQPNDLFFRQKTEQAVARQENFVAGHQFQRWIGRLIIVVQFLLAQITGQSSPRRVGIGFGGADFAFFHHPVQNPAVVVIGGQLAQISLTVEIDPAVAGSHPVQLAVMNHDSHQGSARLAFHAGGGRLPVHRPVGGMQSAVQDGGYFFCRFFCFIGCQEGSHGARAGILAQRQSTHAIRHHGQKSGMADKLRILKRREPEGILLLIPGANMLRIAGNHDTRAGCLICHALHTP